MPPPLFCQASSFMAAVKGKNALPLLLLVLTHPHQICGVGPGFCNSFARATPMEHTLANCLSDSQATGSTAYGEDSSLARGTDYRSKY